MSNREYPERPLVGVGGVVIEKDRVLLVRRGTEPLRGRWSIPGGLLEAGETLVEAVTRELQEETGLTVRAVELIEALDRIFTEPVADPAAARVAPAKPRYHYVILDYLCEKIAGEPRAGGDVTDVALASEDELPAYSLSADTQRILCKAFAMARSRGTGRARLT
jgi:ADP-ribose pyrophosphatase YjhB (NUDIX family)